VEALADPAVSRLEKGTYPLPWSAEQGRLVMKAVELLVVLEGIDSRGSARRARWSPRHGLHATAASV
jgi:hypothetical protein